MFGAFEPARPRKAMQTGNQEPGSSHISMLHAGHCRGKVASV